MDYATACKGQARDEREPMNQRRRGFVCCLSGTWGLTWFAVVHGCTTSHVLQLSFQAHTSKSMLLSKEYGRLFSPARYPKN